MKTPRFWTCDRNDSQQEIRVSRGFHVGDARSLFLTSASKFNIETNSEIFDVSPENDRASPNVKTP